MSQHIDAVAKQSDLDTLNGKIMGIEIRQVSFAYSVNAGARVNTNFKTLVDADLPDGKTYLGIAGLYSGDAHTVINACYYNDSNYSLSVVNVGTTDVTDRTVKIYYMCI